MKIFKRSNLIYTLLVVICLTICIACPILTLAAVKQDANITGGIRLDAIDVVWTNGNGATINQLDLPAYFASGESVDIAGDALKIKNIASSAYLRFSVSAKYNNIESNLITITVDSNWEIGNDGRYYYCGATNAAKLINNQSVVAITGISISNTLKNEDFNDDISITITAEASSTGLNWGDADPPARWFTTTGI